MEDQFVVVELNAEQYGVDIGVVEGIIKLQPITQIPRAPAYVQGVTNLRGKVLPVIDVRQRFGLPAAQASQDTRIVVVEMNGTSVGIMVDRVNEVMKVSDDAIEPPSPIVTTVDSAFLRGIARVSERLVILLDLGQVLSETGIRSVLPLAA
jgi:purine-binding chemotaxis protein CheW